MAKRGETGGKHKLDGKSLTYIAEIVKKLLKESDLSLGEAQDRWGIDKGTLSKVINEDGGTGLHFLMRLRALTGLPLDDLLRHEPLMGEKAPPRQSNSFRTDMQFPLPPAHIDYALENAIKDAEGKGVPRKVIDAVIRIQAQGAPEREERRQQWLGAFVTAWEKQGRPKAESPAADKPAEKRRRAG